jgi:cyclic nucleotide-binding protein/tetratricopeptide repeat protein
MLTSPSGEESAPLIFGQSKDEDVATLITRKQYARAIELIKAQLQNQRDDPRARMQLADVLVLAGRPREATAILRPLADEYARDGFAGKAVAVLKKIQKIDPAQGEVVERLAALIEQRQRQAVALPVVPPRAPEIGMEAIDETPADGPELEIGFGAPISTPAPAASPVEPAPLPAAARSQPAPVEDHDLILEEGGAVDDEPPLVLDDAEPALAIDLSDSEIALEAEPVPEDPRADADFAQELMAVIEEAFPPDLGGPGAPAAAPEPSPAGSRIVVSPLFKDFSVAEVVAVIQGLRLLTFERGNVILREGDRGESLYMLASGRVKAFVRGADGRQNAIGELREGAFFGEISVLTGKPRTATVVATGHCELLELDRATLDQITQSHPHVWDVLREFADRRARRA